LEKGRDMVDNEHSASQNRWFYTKVCIVAYAIWIAAFEAVGYYATTLPSHNLMTSLDRQIPLFPIFIWPYTLCYLFPFLPLMVAKDWHRLNIGLLAIFLSSLIAFVVYIAYPVAFPRLDVGQGLSGRLLSFQYATDFQPGANNFPSLHVAISWIIYFICRKQGLSRISEWSILLLAILITVSTLFVKQHVIFDVAGGFLLAIGTWIAAKYVYLAHSKTDLDAPGMLKFILLKLLPVPFWRNSLIVGLIWFLSNSCRFE
jgi:membrane-associated phospholipid phosphatase